MSGEQPLVLALDNHEQHIAMHQRLLAMPWLRNRQVAARVRRTDAPQIMQGIQNHIMQHMNFLAGNQTSSVQTSAGQTPGQPRTQLSPAMGHASQVALPQPNPGAPMNAPAQAQAVQDHTHLPQPPSMPQPRQ